MKIGFKDIKKIISIRLAYLFIGIMLSIATVAFAAVWSDSKTGGTGQLSEAQYNALIDHLSTTGPTTWTCAWVDGTTGANSIGDCSTLGAGYRLIVGGCATSPAATGVITASNPAGALTQGGWSCWASGAQVIARAWCCK